MSPYKIILLNHSDIKMQIRLMTSWKFWSRCAELKLIVPVLNTVLYNSIIKIKIKIKFHISPRNFQLTFKKRLFLWLNYRYHLIGTTILTFKKKPPLPTFSLYLNSWRNYKKDLKYLQHTMSSLSCLENQESCLNFIWQKKLVIHIIILGGNSALHSVECR